MSARAVTIVDALKTVFAADATLAGWFITGGVSRIYTFRDPFKIEDSNPIYPYMNLNVHDIKTGDADNIRQADMARMTFPIAIYYACSSLDEELVLRGALTATPAVPGLFDIHDKLWDVLRAEPDLGGSINYAAGIKDFGTQTGKSQAGEDWIGRGLMIKEVYQNISKY